jgi:hypothetical protein
MKLIILGIAFFLGMGWIIGMICCSSERDAETRRQLLLRLASTLWPHLDMCAALDCLYAQTLREIKAKYAKGDDTNDLQDDLFVIMNERNRLFTEEDNSVSIHVLKQS